VAIIHIRACHWLIRSQTNEGELAVKRSLKARRWLSIGTACAIASISACTPSTPTAVNPATCARTQSAAFSIPAGNAATAVQISGNGRYAVGQVNNGTGPSIPNLLGWSERFNVYRWDRLGGSTPTQLNPAGTTARFPVISNDGRYVAYERVANGDYPPSHYVIDVVDTLTSVTTQITNTVAPARSTDPAISDDGRFVAFMSDATNLVPGDPDVNDSMDVFVWDRTTGLTKRLTDQTPGYVSFSALFAHAGLELSGDGSTVLVPKYDVSNHVAIQLINTTTAAVTLAADVAPLPPLVPGDPTGFALVLTSDLSTNGTVAGFITPGLPSGVTPPGGPDLNRNGDQFLFNRSTSTLTQVTNPALNSAGGPNAQEYPVAVSGNGQFVTFMTNLVDPADTVTSPPALSTDLKTVIFDRFTNTFNSVVTAAVSDQSTNGEVLVGQVPMTNALYFWAC
jgi:hypothetical protein